jgi:hypothetical protein
MTPTVLYHRLNHIIWLGRLPRAKIVRVDDATIPECDGLTFPPDHLLRRPIILLNGTDNHWEKTLIHEMLHIAEPRLRHGKIFAALENLYRRNLKELDIL